MKYIFWFFLFFICMSVYSFSPKIESFQVINYSKKSLIVSIELWGGIGIPKKNYIVESEINGIELMITDNISIINTDRITPGRRIDIVRYFPVYNEEYEEMRKIPFMEKMRGIFKRFEIIFDDSSMQITLEDLNNIIVKKQVLAGETSYILEIFDYQLVGKPALNW